MTEVGSEDLDFVSMFRDRWRRIQRLSERNLAASGLSVSELRILKMLKAGPSPMARFANELYMTPASVTGLVDKLEAERLVERERGAEDRRVVRVRITPRGSARLESGLKLNNKFTTHAFKSLTREEARQLILLLDKLAIAAERLSSAE